MENPKSKEICENANEFIEKWCKIGLFIMKYVVVPCFMFPKVALSIFIYFTTDAGNDAFLLPLYMW